VVFVDFDYTIYRLFQKTFELHAFGFQSFDYVRN